MFVYLAMLLISAAPVELQQNRTQDRGIYVPRENFDCFVRQVQSARRGQQLRPARDVYYLDLRRCPPRANVDPAPRRLGSFPSFRRPLPPVSRFPDFRGVAANNAPVDRVLVVTGAELNCMADRRRLNQVRSQAGPGRYRLELDRCPR